MSESEEVKTLPVIKSEMDIPQHRPSTPEKHDISELTPSEKRDFIKWQRGYIFLLIILVTMGFLYGIDVFLSIRFPNVNVDTHASLFEALRAMLFIVLGYVFAKSKE